MPPYATCSSSDESTERWRSLGIASPRARTEDGTPSGPAGAEVIAAGPCRAAHRAARRATFARRLGDVVLSQPGDRVGEGVAGRLIHGSATASGILAPTLVP